MLIIIIILYYGLFPKQLHRFNVTELLKQVATLSFAHYKTSLFSVESLSNGCFCVRAERDVRVVTDDLWLMTMVSGRLVLGRGRTREPTGRVPGCKLCADEFARYFWKLNQITIWMVC